MAQNEFELHPDRLSTTDEKGRRIYVHPADVAGRFRVLRGRVQAVLIVFFLILPWIRVHGKQALLLDVSHRHFEIFGLSLRAHNAPLLILVLAAAAFGLFFATAVFGRVWCGWACPQTVFIDGVYRRIERWVDGGALQRRQLDQAPMSFSKLSRRAWKWSLYMLVTLVITHSFLAYFVGSEELEKMIFRSPLENWGTFLFIAFLTAIVLFDFAWFREQFCTIVCPYGRFQSVLMDQASLIVAYDGGRGEPRATREAKTAARATGQALGDCVNCYRCVQVCPTGIDIRRGVQLECIACTSCIDACDDVMTKLKRPTGLIRYDSLLGLAGKKRRLSIRSITYLALFLGSVSTLLVLLSQMQTLDVQILRAKDTPYTTQTMADGSVFVVNHLKLEISNQSESEEQLDLVIEENAVPPADSVKSTETELQLIMAERPIHVPSGQVVQKDLFLRFPKTYLKNGELKVRVKVKKIVSEKESVPAAGHIRESNSKNADIEREVTLVGPFS